MWVVSPRLLLALVVTLAFAGCGGRSERRELAPTSNASVVFTRDPFLNWYAIPYPFAVAQGPGGALHVLSCDGSGWYATNGSGAWQFLTLPTDAPSGGWCSLWVDADGLDVLYANRINTSLSYAHHPGTEASDAAWTGEMLPSSGYVLSVELWRSRDGRTWAAYVVQSGAMTLAERVDGTWRTEQVAEIGGDAWLTLSGSDDGEPWLLSDRLDDIYGNAFFTSRSDAGLTDTQLSKDATSSMDFALAVHHQGIPELAFQYSRHGIYGPPGHFSRVEAHRLTPSGWQHTVVDDDLWSDCMGIGVDGSGVAHLAMVGRATVDGGREFRSYRRDAGRWTRDHTEVLDAAAAGSTCSVFVDETGAVTLFAADESENVFFLTNRETTQPLEPPVPK